jgi:GH24 family phage-related lysozyme (muramidase)
MTVEYYNQIGRSVLNDFVRAGAQSLVSKGLAPASSGITKAIPEVTDTRGAFDYFRSIQGEQMTAQGGAGLDAFDTPSGKRYADRRYSFLAEAEAARDRAYDDKTGKTVAGQPKLGNITVGIGFNMDREGARDSFAKYLPGVSFDEVYKGKRALTQIEMRRLFDFTSQEAENIVNTRLKGVALTEHQRLALVSMAFNSPKLIGPKLTAAMKSGDKAAAVREILFNSNISGNKGLANRRYKEATMFMGTEMMAALPSYAEYIRKYS